MIEFQCIAPAVLAALIGGGSSLLGSLGGIFSNLRTQRSVDETNAANIAAQESINSQNVQSQQEINSQNLAQQWKMWNATNDYNHPAAQMARYRAAGLNPNLIYGQSNTSQPVQVGTSQAPKQLAIQRHAMQYANVMQNINLAESYYNAMKAKEEVNAMQLDNEITAATKDDMITKSGLSVELLQHNISSIKKDIEIKGFVATYKELENELMRFETEMVPLMRKMKHNELSLSNSQVDLIPLIKTREELQNKLTSMQIQLGYSQFVLNNAKTERELSEIGLNESSAAKMRKEIELFDKRIEEISSTINLNTAKMNQMGFDAAGKFLGNAIEAYGSLRGGLDNSLDINIGLGGRFRKAGKVVKAAKKIK